MLHKLLCIFALYLPFQLALNPTPGIDLASIRVFALIIFFIWLANSLKNKSVFMPSRFLTFLVVSFLFFSLFSALTAENTLWSARKLLFLLSFFPLFFIISDISWNKNKLQTFCSYLVWGAGVSASIGIFQFILQFFIGVKNTTIFWSNITTPFLGKTFSMAVFQYNSWLVEIGNTTLMRAISFFPDPHMFSFYLSMIFPASLALYFLTYKKQYLFLSLFILIANFLSFSRGGYLGFLSGTFFFLLLIYKGKITRLKNLKYYIGMFFALLLLVFFIPNPINQRFFSSFNANEGSNSERIQIWSQALQIIKENPLFGVGIGNYSLAISPNSNYRTPIYAHNTYLDLAVETGIINAIIWIVLILWSIIKLARNKSNILFAGFGAGIVAFSVHSFFDTAIFSVHILPVLIFFLSFAIIKYDSNTSIS
jgi:O-antigen ligase